MLAFGFSRNRMLKFLLKSLFVYLDKNQFQSSYKLSAKHFIAVLCKGKILIATKLILMLLACHKKSYLICDEITNFRIFTQPIPKFFSKYKTETAKTGQRQLLENK